MAQKDARTILRARTASFILMMSEVMGVSSNRILRRSSPAMAAASSRISSSVQSSGSLVSTPLRSKTAHVRLRLAEERMQSMKRFQNSRRRSSALCSCERVRAVAYVVDRGRENKEEESGRTRRR